MEKSYRAIILVFLLTVTGLVQAQDDIEKTIREIYNSALTSSEAYENLRYLCKNTKGRIAGSPQAAKAVEYTRQWMTDLDLDTVYLQEVQVPKWVRGEENAKMISPILGTMEVEISALGTSIGTPGDGMTGKVIEVHSLDELDALGKSAIAGRIVFFNRPMDPTIMQTFSAYGRAVDQRTAGPAAAAGMGAIAAIVRSVTTRIDRVPHTGVTIFTEKDRMIPAISISTQGADLLSKWLESDPGLTFQFTSTCKNFPEVTSYNVIGEIRGSLYPDEIITVGGHLDAWDTGEGAHDDGAGCIQAIEVLRLYKSMGVEPKRTIRAVMFMDEEISQSGAKVYFNEAKRKNEKHYMAMESDRGALVPRSVAFTAPEERMNALIDLEKYFKPYSLENFKRGGGGPDVGRLTELGAIMVAYLPDVQRYFDFHHSANDAFEEVHFRELQLGSAAMASIIYLIDFLDL